MTTDNVSRTQTAGALEARSADDAASDPSDRELHFTRVFNAPRSVVFRAWTDPEQAIHWYGPQGFTVELMEMDVRVGGKWRKCMRSPEGVDYWRHGIYREVVEPQRLVFTYVTDDPQGVTGHETLVTIDFVDQGRRTRMMFRQALFDTAGNCDSHRGGWSSCMERFAAYLAQSA